MARTSQGRAKDLAQADAPLPPGALPAPASEREHSARQPPAAWIAQALIEPAQAAGRALYVASSERRADEIGRALRQLAPEIEVLTLPPWDCLPYDRASPSREAMGRRMATLQRLRETCERPQALVASVEALLQRTPPAKAFRSAFLELRVGQRLDRAALEAFARATGYVAGDRVDEPGEINILGEVVDIYPAGAEAPIRITLGAEDRIEDIRRYDPISQRSVADLDAAPLGPASELILDPAPEAEREPGLEHRAAEIYGAMETVFDALGEAAVACDARATERAKEFDEQVVEAYEARRAFGEEAKKPPAPKQLYLDSKALLRELKRRPPLVLPSAAVESIPNFTLARNPGRALVTFVKTQREAGRRVLLTGLRHELRPVLRALKRGLDAEIAFAADWAGAMAADAQAPVALLADLDAGFVDAQAGVALIAAPDVLGGRIAGRSTAGAATLITEPDLREGDVVLHEDHGVGVLKALDRVAVNGEDLDALHIEYHSGATLMAPIEEFGRIWRYNGEPESVSLDRLHTDQWQKKKAELSREIDAIAQRLVELARARAETPGAILEPPRTEFARFAARFPYPETADQSAAIDAVLKDLASGRVMNRLVCGDVGFGKTEIALRAAAAAALAGKQVALIAPTTVLARQHYETFRRRFAGTGLEVGHLSRLIDGAEAKAVKAALAEGSLKLVIGTHALASADVAFADLGLLIVDEEQKFGAKLKARLAELAPGVHRLTLSATPIPRTLQLAMVGVEDVSLLATPPGRRRPIRTFVAPYDAATVRAALLRERRRGGQSFIVAPRIADIAPMAEQLGAVVPELSVRVAHGELPPEEVDETMVAFAGGEGDVLLATNIIESGLDVPRANTILLLRADMFGLAQLHQLRGRVGRGRAQGLAYLFTDPEQETSEATRARLSTLVAFDRLGSGLAIAARDLEIRGAGDLVGEQQAGHVTLLGAAFYQELLSRAVAAAKGEAAPGVRHRAEHRPRRLDPRELRARRDAAHQPLCASGSVERDRSRRRLRRGAGGSVRSGSPGDRSADRVGEDKSAQSRRARDADRQRPQGHCSHVRSGRAAFGGRRSQAQRRSVDLGAVRGRGHACVRGNTKVACGLRVTSPS